MKIIYSIIEYRIEERERERKRIVAKCWNVEMK